jgi:hypothetical protein
MLRHELSYHHGEAAIDVIRRMRYLRPAYELRETWHYNNMVRVTVLFCMAGTKKTFRAI